MKFAQRLQAFITRLQRALRHEERQGPGRVRELTPTSVHARRGYLGSSAEEVDHLRGRNDELTVRLLEVARQLADANAELRVGWQDRSRDVGRRLRPRYEDGDDYYTGGWVSP